MLDDRMQNLAKMLDVAALRHEVHAANVANLNTPGYKAQEVHFEDAFAQALGNARDGGQQARKLQAEVVTANATPVGNDGNDVDLDREVALMSENNLNQRTYLQLLRGKLSLLQTAIGRGG